MKDVADDDQKTTDDAQPTLDADNKANKGSVHKKECVCECELHNLDAVHNKAMNKKDEFKREH